MDTIGDSKWAKSAAAKAGALAKTSEPFLLAGPKGSGKTFLAGLIHKQSAREAERFTIFDTASHSDIPKALFGFVRKNILGIENIDAGAIDLTGSGTILIKDMQLLPLDIQMQLAATIQLGGYRPVGSEESLHAYCRFGFSVSRPLQGLREEKRILPELFQLLSNNMIELQPLKERPEDIEFLSRHFLEKWSANLGLPDRRLSKAAVKLLKRYTWPGNVAELQTVILGALIHFNEREIDAKHLQLKIDGNWHIHTDEQLEEIALEELVEKKLSQFMTRLGKYDIENLHGAIIERVERPLIRLAMKRANNNQLKAAKMLGINRNTLRTKLQKLEIL